MTITLYMRWKHKFMTHPPTMIPSPPVSLIVSPETVTDSPHQRLRPCRHSDLL